LRTFLMMSVTATRGARRGARERCVRISPRAGGLGRRALLTVFYAAAITSLFIVLPHLGPANYAVVLNFEPIAALALAWAILGQGVAPLQIAARSS
jgi:drug/metabolite transporter (DMT)-like permease